MGRGKVEVRKIENKTTRQVTFSKRRKGLMKKTQELSVLCDAQIGLIIFSSTGKKFEFCSDPNSMTHIIEEYLKCTGKRIHEHDNKDEIHKEWRRIKAETQSIEQSLHLYSSEGLALLSYQNLEQLEQQLEYSVSKIRARKNQLFEQQMENLNRKVQLLDEENSKLHYSIREHETLGYNQYQPQQVPALQWKMQNDRLMQLPDTEQPGSSTANDQNTVLQLANINTYHPQQQLQSDPANVITDGLLTL